MRRHLLMRTLPFLNLSFYDECVETLNKSAISLEKKFNANTTRISLSWIRCRVDRSTFGSKVLEELLYPIEKQETP